MFCNVLSSVFCNVLSSVFCNVSQFHLDTWHLVPFNTLLCPQPIVQMVRDGNGGGCSDVEESLLDECAGLSSKIFIPDFRFTYGNESSAFAIFAQNSFPLCFTFGSVPDLMLNFGKRPADCFPAVTPDTRQKRDAVRHINLGTCPNQPVRQCTRCGCLSLLRTASAPSQLINSWERRFVVECLCGGQWKLMTAGI